MLDDLLPLLAAVFTSRRDSAMALVKAVLEASQLRYFHPGWVSHTSGLNPATAYKTLEQGTCDPDGLLHASVHVQDHPDDYLAIDATFIEKAKSSTSPDRVRTVTKEGYATFRSKVGWSLLVAVLLDNTVEATSWVLPVAVRMCTPTTQTQLVVELVITLRQAREHPFTVLLDAGFDVHAITTGIMAVCSDVRVISRRAKTTRYIGVGETRKYDRTRTFKAGVDEGDDTVTLSHPYYGTVTLTTFWDVTQERGGSVPGHGYRVSCTRIGARVVNVEMVLFETGATHSDPLEVFYSYLRRFTIEHFFRFVKQHWGLTQFKCQQPVTLLNWVMVLFAAYWCLRVLAPAVKVLPYWLRTRRSQVTPFAVWYSIRAVSGEWWTNHPVTTRPGGQGWPPGRRRRRREKYPMLRKGVPKGSPAPSNWVHSFLEVVEGLPRRDELG